jgi:hypothetical protein
MWGNFVPHYKPPTNMITITFTNCVTYKWENEHRRCECSNRPQGVIKWGVRSKTD